MWSLLHYAGARLYWGPLIFSFFMSTSVNWILLQIQHLHIMWLCGPLLLSWLWCRVWLKSNGINWIFCLRCTPQNWRKRGKKGFFFSPPDLPSLLQSCLYSEKRQVNVMKSASLAKWVWTWLPCEAPEASYLWKAKQDTPWNNVRKAPCLRPCSQFNFVSPKFATVAVCFWSCKMKNVDRNISRTAGEAPHDKLSLLDLLNLLWAKVVFGDGRLRSSWWWSYFLLFVCIPLIPCNSTLFYLKNYSNYSWIKRPKISCLFIVFWNTQDKPKGHCSIYFKNKSILKCDVKMVCYGGGVSKGDSWRDNLEQIRRRLRFSCNVISIQALSVSQCDGRQKNTKYM